MTHRLKFNPPASDGMGKWHAVQVPHYFVALGDPWRHRPELRMISKVTADPAQAATFPTIAEATEVLALCGEPEGWSLEVVE